MEQILTICSIVAAVSLFVVGYKYISLQKEYTEYKVTTEVKLGNLESELNKAKLTIDEQNNKIKEYKATVEDSAIAINDLKSRLSFETKEKIEYIDTELKKDNSSENQLKLLNGILHEFSKGN